jgi:hypothetical protein
MARTKRLWRPLKAWHPHEWAPFKEAWQRVEASVGGALWLTQRDLRQAFLDGRLITAVRRIAPNGTETRFILEPAFWQPVKINYAWSITGYEAEVREGEQWVFVVRRRELDRNYPAVSATTPIERQPDDEQATTKRKPGKKIKKDWKLTAAAELHRFIEAERRTPSAPELAQRVDKNLKYYPDESDVRKLIRFLLSE